MDMPGILRQNAARMVAVCDLDSLRVADAKELVEGHYRNNKVSLTVATYGDYREALQHPDINAVAVSTPDHWHAEPVIAAALAGKDIYVQKPLSMTIAEGRAEFPKSGLWNVHGPYHIEAKYANSVTVLIEDKLPNGIRFEGSDGWIFVTRGAERMTSSDPNPTGSASKSLVASNPDILATPLGAKDVRLHESPNGDHHLDWITSIQTRKPAVTSAEIGHRSTSACITGDAAANAMPSRPQRAPCGIDHMKK
jgi:hypothetical protein